MKTDRKPPLARSPMRLRARRVLQLSNVNTHFSPSTGTMAKFQTNEFEIRPEYQSISCEFSALSKMVEDQLGAMNHPTKSGSGFERGLLYDNYIARRNERLRKKQSVTEVDVPKSAYSLGVKVELGTKKEIKKKSESLKKFMSVDRSQHPRYALRSTVKKPPLPVPMDVDERTTTRKTVAAAR